MAVACAVLSAAVAGCAGGREDAGTGPGGEVRALTGGHTRVVWVQSDENDPRAAGERLVLMGLDSRDGQGERVILGNRGSYVKPLITPGGERIVFSTRPVPGPPEVFTVNWDGTGLRKLSDGFALAVWQDPVDRSEWVYVGTDLREIHFASVWRFPIDAPDRRELVWNKSLVSFDTFQVSADGRRAGGLWPWPAAGVAELPNGELTTYGQGCWTALALARGPLFWYFDGAHRNLTLVDVDTGARWMVNVNHAEGFDGAEVYFPRWANHPRFLVLAGPYNQGGPNQARTGGPQVEVYLGRFSDDFSRVEAWARVTNNGSGDSYPDVWIDPAASPYPLRPGGAIGPGSLRAGAGSKGAAGEAAGSRLALNVRLTSAGPVPTPQEILPYRNALVVNEYEVVDVVEGAYPERVIRIAQWAIRDGRTLPEAHKIAGAAFTLVVDRYDAHPELEGERLVAAGGTSALALYYDLGT